MRAHRSNPKRPAAAGRHRCVDGCIRSGGGDMRPRAFETPPWLLLLTQQQHPIIAHEDERLLTTHSTPPTTQSQPQEQGGKQAKTTATKAQPRLAGHRTSCRRTFHPPDSSFACPCSRLSDHPSPNTTPIPPLQLQHLPLPAAPRLQPREQRHGWVRAAGHGGAAGRAAGGAVPLCPVPAAWRGVLFGVAG